MDFKNTIVAMDIPNSIDATISRMKLTSSNEFMGLSNGTDAASIIAKANKTTIKTTNSRHKIIQRIILNMAAPFYAIGWLNLVHIF